MALPTNTFRNVYDAIDSLVRKYSITFGGAPVALAAKSLIDDKGNALCVADSSGNPLFPQGVSISTAVAGLTAFAGGGQQSASPVTAQINQYTTVATAADSATLPLAVAGMDGIVIANAAAANSMNVFPNTGDKINALSSNAAFAVAAGKTATFYSPVAGQWHAVLSA